MANNTKYISKAKDSFKTKFNIYLFDKIINDSIDHISLLDFEKYKIDIRLVDLYITVYWQQEAGETINNKKLSEIETSLNDWQKKNEKLIEALKKQYIERTFPLLFTKFDFDILTKKEECEYCNITIKEIEVLSEKRRIKKKNLRGWTLEIDRIDSNLEYFAANCVMACYWCNNAKTDEFTYDEFKKIGQSIKEVWKGRKDD